MLIVMSERTGDALLFAGGVRTMMDGGPDDFARVPTLM